MARLGRIARAALMAAVLVATVGWTLAVPAAQVVRAWDPGTFSASDESLLMSLTNQARASAGLAPLRYDAQLHSLAEWRAQDMSLRNYFSHNIPPEGYLVFHYMDVRGIQYVLAGENIGWDNAPDDQATAMVQDMFMNSPEHRSNILGTAWDSMGVGAYKGTDGVIKYCVLFKESPAAPAATPKPTPNLTPHPTPPSTPPPAQRATPEPTVPPTPQPTRQPAPAETPVATPAPATPEPPAPTATARPTPTEPASPGATASLSATASPSASPTLAPGTPFVSPDLTPTVSAEPSTQPASQRIIEDAPAPGLLDSVMAVLLGLLGSI